MKKVILTVIALVIVSAVIVGLSQPSASSDFLRIHIRANSNDNADQTVKYAVKTAVVEYLTPYIAQAHTKQQATKIVADNIDGICAAADRVLAEYGFDYTSSAVVATEEFPVRAYDGLTLDSGLYDALIVNLGEGQGNNWWCVVYPPLCFVGGESNGTNSIVYKSKILEIIEQWKGSK